MDFKVKDLVFYGTIDQVMVIEKIDGEDATCGWIDKKGKKRTAVFKINTLDKYEGPPMGFRG